MSHLGKQTVARVSNLNIDYYESCRETDYSQVSNLNIDYYESFRETDCSQGK